VLNAFRGSGAEFDCREFCINTRRYTKAATRIAGYQDVKSLFYPGLEHKNRFSQVPGKAVSLE